MIRAIFPKSIPKDLVTILGKGQTTYPATLLTEKKQKQKTTNLFKMHLVLSALLLTSDSFMCPC